MARRGPALRDHILDTAKDLFLGLGFERTSMDAVAAHAETSKRSLYAHFPTKDQLFLAVVERSRELFTGRMLTPDHYATEPAEAVARYCGRFLQMLGWSPIVQMLRLGISEADRLGEDAVQVHQALFGTVTVRLTDYLAAHYTLSPAEASRLADRLLGIVIHPRLLQLLLGATPPTQETPDETHLAADVDLPTIRSAVQQLLPRP